MKKFFFIATLFIAFVFTALGAQANMTIPNSFTSGTPALAGEVNDNFNTIETAMPGLEFSTGGFVALTSAEATIDTLLITAPTSGYIVVTAFGNVTCDNVAGSSILRLENATEGEITNTWTNVVETTNWHRYTITHVFTVGVGTDTINLRGYCSGAGATGSINVSTFYALFFPNRY